MLTDKTLFLSASSSKPPHLEIVAQVQASVLLAVCTGISKHSPVLF